MSKALIGKKREMSQIFNDQGAVVPVTIIEAGPCAVTQVKRADGPDGYNAYQISGIERSKNVPKPQLGHFKKAGVKPAFSMREVRFEGEPALKVGDAITVEAFAVGEMVDVQGHTKGRGFAGGIKRHGFSGGPGAHGTKFMREGGSVGQNTSPSHIWPGKRMAGHLGNEKVTARNLLIVKVDKERNLLYVRGAVPGHPEAEVFVRPAVAGSLRKPRRKKA